MEDVKYIEKRVKEVFTNLVFNFDYKKEVCEVEIKNYENFKNIFFELNYIDVMNDFSYYFEKIKYYIRIIQR